MLDGVARAPLRVGAGGAIAARPDDVSLAEASRARLPARSSAPSSAATAYVRRGRPGGRGTLVPRAASLALGERSHLAFDPAATLVFGAERSAPR